MFEPADLLAATHAVVLMSLDHRLVPTANDAVEKNRLKCAPVEMVDDASLVIHDPMSMKFLLQFNNTIIQQP